MQERNIDDLELTKVKVGALSSRCMVQECVVRCPTFKRLCSFGLCENGYINQ